MVFCVFALMGILASTPFAANNIFLFSQTDDMQFGVLLLLDNSVVPA